MKNAARPFYKSGVRADEARPAFALRPIAYCVMLACCEHDGRGREQKLRGGRQICE